VFGALIDPIESPPMRYFAAVHSGHIPKKARRVIFQAPGEHHGGLEMSLSDEDLRCAAFREAGHAVVARFFGLPVGDHLEIADDGSGKTEIGSADQLSLSDQIAVCLAGVAAQDLFGFPKPRAGYADHAKIIGLVEGLTEAESLELREAAYARAREIIKNQKLEVEWLGELLIKERS
jgi:hypothetical protein